MSWKAQPLLILRKLNNRQSRNKNSDFNPVCVYLQEKFNWIEDAFSDLLVSVFSGLRGADKPEAMESEFVIRFFQVPPKSIQAPMMNELDFAEIELLLWHFYNSSYYSHCTFIFIRSCSYFTRKNWFQVEKEFEKKQWQKWMKRFISPLDSNI